ncbi:hypothetical protein [Photobacterium damselae]|uniref:hypothetical protein n=1 Tax=Photobacterium damselae TaxID=38293 RepID=UPI001F4229A1|nr:hypothetical protein [Photobacterium damselae]UKA12906.1 hypothetical protein IHC91_21550 [Photobacterium damselae subsp. damselae]
MTISKDTYETSLNVLSYYKGREDCKEMIDHHTKIVINYELKYSSYSFKNKNGVLIEIPYKERQENLKRLSKRIGVPHKRRDENTLTQMMRIHEKAKLFRDGFDIK